MHANLCGFFVLICYLRETVSQNIEWQKEEKLFQCETKVVNSSAHKKLANAAREAATRWERYQERQEKKPPILRSFAWFPFLNKHTRLHLIRIREWGNNKVRVESSSQQAARSGKRLLLSKKSSGNVCCVVQHEKPYNVFYTSHTALKSVYSWTRNGVVRYYLSLSQTQLYILLTHTSARKSNRINKNQIINEKNSKKAKKHIYED